MELMLAEIWVYPFPSQRLILTLTNDRHAYERCIDRSRIGYGLTPPGGGAIPDIFGY